ncbi:MAG TPA: DUF1580 domain-containing protein [Phycisphaerae bacterium]|nr:DUF1580 domain-containing protein [Phycisphaerae bacterium]
MTDTAHINAPLLPDARQTAGESVVRRSGSDAELITLAEAARHLPRIDGRKVSVCTLWRWARRGLRGARLEYVRVGRRVCTTREALMRFFTNLAELDERVPPPGRPAFPAKRKPITSRQRQHALAEADEILERARI